MKTTTTTPLPGGGSITVTTEVVAGTDFEARAVALERQSRDAQDLIAKLHQILKSRDSENLLEAASRRMGELETKEHAAAGEQVRALDEELRALVNERNDVLAALGLDPGKPVLVAVANLVGHLGQLRGEAKQAQELLGWRPGETLIDTVKRTCALFKCGQGEPLGAAAERALEELGNIRRRAQATAEAGADVAEIRKLYDTRGAEMVQLMIAAGMEMPDANGAPKLKVRIAHLMEEAKLAEQYRAAVIEMDPYSSPVGNCRGCGSKRTEDHGAHCLWKVAR